MQHQSTTILRSLMYVLQKSQTVSAKTLISGRTDNSCAHKVPWAIEESMLWKVSFQLLTQASFSVTRINFCGNPTFAAFKSYHIWKYSQGARWRTQEGQANLCLGQSILRDPHQEKVRRWFSRDVWQLKLCQSESESESVFTSISGCLRLPCPAAAPAVCVNRQQQTLVKAADPGSDCIFNTNIIGIIQLCYSRI